MSGMFPFDPWYPLNTSVPMGLGMPRDEDLFQTACRLADAPPGLLGKFDPPVWGRLAARFGKPNAEWTSEDWERAARILGLMLYQTEQDERLRKILDSPPRRRGPKPRLRADRQGKGLLPWLDSPEPKRRGRPVIWPEDRLQGVWAIAARFRQKLAEQGLPTTDKAVLDRMLDYGWKQAKRSDPRLSKKKYEAQHRGPWRNALIRAKKLCSE